LHGGYQFGSGVGLGVDVGYLAMFASAKGRATTMTPQGKTADAVVSDDDVRLSGLTIGASAFFHQGDEWPITLRFGAGVLLGTARDVRTGTGTNSFGEPFAASVTGSASATYLYAVPEARIGKRFGDHFELSLGVEAMLLASIKQPKFPDSIIQNSVAANPQKIDPTTGRVNNGDGEGPFAADALSGSLILSIAPSIAARYDF
jgi:hypothetical protein